MEMELPVCQRALPCDGQAAFTWHGRPPALTHTTRLAVAMQLFQPVQVVCHRQDLPHSALQDPVPVGFVHWAGRLPGLQEG
jgi:hypothetical protein